MTLDQELNLFTETLPSITENRNYWLIRTQKGSLYPTFIDNDFVAIEHDDLSLEALAGLRSESRSNNSLLQASIKKEVFKKNKKLLENDKKYNKTLSIRASQIYKFYAEVKRGDIVVIPSENSDVVSFGEIKESYIGKYTAAEIKKMDCNYILKKRVMWRQHVLRKNMDPYLYKLFQAHQAINEVSKYSNIIERSMGDFYVLDEEAHLILNILTEDKISATSLFGLGYDILRMVDEFANFAGIDIKSTDLNVEINLNSPGKIDLKSKIRKTTLVTGLVLLVAGGGLEYKSLKLKTDGIPGLIKAIDEFFTHKQNRELKEEIYDKYKDSLKVKDPQDLIKLMDQVSDFKR